MLQRFFLMTMLGVLLAIGCGCPCCAVLADEATGAKKAALGAETRVPTAEEAKIYQLAKFLGKTQGQYISGMEKEGPAEKAGLKPGDVILALDANKIFSRDDIEDFLRVSQPSSKVKLLVERDGTHKQETVTVTLGVQKVEDKEKHLAWQYAGLGQMDAALATAKKDGKLVLVGLSGADT
jgi:membrane-associated protease RseP (regulator of RpoE activity)